MRTYLGVDIGGTKTAVVLGNERAETIRKIAFETDHVGGPEAVLEGIKGAVDELVGAAVGTGLVPSGCSSDVTSHVPTGAEAARCVPAVAAVGVSCGGPLDSAAGVVLGPPNLPGWDEVPVVEILSRHTGLPVRLENDANAGALAEWRFGAGRGSRTKLASCARRNLVFITAGTGLGCGLIVDGRLYSGTNDMAGEAGHIRLAPYGPRGYGKFGSFEGFCSGGGIARLGLQMLDEAARRGERSLLFRARLEGPLTTQAIAEAAQEGDELAHAILRRAGQRLGEGLAVLIDVLNPEVIVLGSLAVRLGELYLGPAREVIAREALQRSAEVCRIVPAELGERAGEVAALCVAMEADAECGARCPGPAGI